MAINQRKRLSSKQIWSIKRNEERDFGDNGYIDCMYCETPIHYIESEIDHIIPVSQGGVNRKKNLVTVCKDCNQSKQNAPLEQFCKIYGMDFTAILDRLELRGKNLT